MKIVEVCENISNDIVISFVGNNTERQQVRSLLQSTSASYSDNDKQVLAFFDVYQLVQLIDKWSVYFNEGKFDLQKILQQKQVVWSGNGFSFNLTFEPLIYAIINCTPDSFFDGNENLNVTTVLKRVEQDLNNGAKIFDIGGKSSRPGFSNISAKEEWERISPYITAIQQEFPQAILAVDTNTYEVMQAALAKGIPIINNIDGFKKNNTKQLLAEYQPSIVSMHNNRYYPQLENVSNDLYDTFKQDIELFTALGLNKEQICIDPGIGFSFDTNPLEDMQRIKTMRRLKMLNVALMVAVSRKSFMGKLFNIELEDRLLMSKLVESLMIQNGGRVIRVHDVAQTQQVAQLLKLYQSLGVC